MTTICGVDLSLAGTGLATWRDGRVYPPVTIVTTNQASKPARHHQIVTRILRQADPTGRTLYVVEDRIVGDVQGNSVLELEQLRGVLYYAIWKTGHTLAVVPIGTLKVWATGHGKASKESMVDAARGRLGHHAFVHNHNEADGLWLMDIALHRYGVKLWRPPTPHLRALGTPEWPEFSLEEDDD